MCSGLALVALLRRKSGDSEGDTEQPRPTIFRAPQVCGAEEYRDVGCKAAGKAYSVLRNAHVNMPEIDMGAAWQPRQVSASAFIRYCLWLASHSLKQYISRNLTSTELISRCRLSSLVQSFSIPIEWRWNNELMAVGCLIWHWRNPMPQGKGDSR